MTACNVILQLASADPVCQNITKFDLSDFVKLQDDDLKFLSNFGHLVKKFIMRGYDLTLLPLQQSILDLFCPLTNMTHLVICRTDLLATLRFLTILPPSLVNLELDNLDFPAHDFITYAPTLANQLDRLCITNNLQLTCYHLISILQGFWKLDMLDIRNTEFIRAGTCTTILNYCYNLQTFYFSSLFKLHDARAWIDLVEFDFQHVEFDTVTYAEVATYKECLVDGLVSPSDSSDEEF